MYVHAACTVQGMHVAYLALSLQWGHLIPQGTGEWSQEHLEFIMFLYLFRVSFRLLSVQRHFDCLFFIYSIQLHVPVYG